jgi:hypothetical protein
MIYTLIAIFVLILSGIAIAYSYHVGPFHSNSQTSTNLSPATNDQKKAGDTTKQNSSGTQNSKQNTTGSDQPPTPTPQANSNKRIVEVSITAANQNGSLLQVRSLISAVVNTGTCTLTLTGPQANPIVKNSDTQALSTTSTCKGFDIPLSELSPGTWQVVIAYNSDSLTGSASKTVTIKAQ